MGFFSFFSRKKRRKSESATGPDSANGLSARELARLTAEKIDEIESQMVAEGTSLANPAAEAAAPAKAASAPSASAPAAAAPVARQPKRNSIEIHGSGLLPVLEEVSVLFANGQTAEATTVLRHAIHQDQLGDHTRLAWKMLLELYQASGLRQEFENLAIEYASSFELSPPAWDDELVLVVTDQGPAASSSTVLFPAVIDAQVVKQTEQMSRAIQRKRLLRIDFSRVTTVDMIGADLLLRALRDFLKGKQELTVIGVEALEKALRPMTESGRRDPDEHGWALRLMSLRMLGQQQHFEDLAIEYCVTYEVSPPSWEPLPDTIKVVLQDCDPVTETEEPPAAYVGDTFVMSGVLTGRSEIMFQQLRGWAEPRAEVVFDCRELVRIDFACTSELLNEVAALHRAGKQIVIRKPSYLVAYLMIVMGLGDLAEMQLRHA
ncbi:MAG: STAS domain-containing protein [Lautropia sp.]|nr:STAS domain-containing protein [Lautropia sp.]